MEAKKYPRSGRPVAATALAKAGAAQFLGTLRSEGFTSLRDDLIEGIEAAANLTSARKAVIYVGDGNYGNYLWGEPNDVAKLINEITSRNVGRAKIHTVGVSPYPYAEEFLKKLAARNGGTYKRVE